MADDVRALYTLRKTLRRRPFDPGCEAEVRAFIELFVFEPTPDLLKCLEVTENNMVTSSSVVLVSAIICVHEDDQTWF